MNEHESWIKLAETLSLNSKDPNVQFGCVIVSPENEELSRGWNHIPRGVNDTDPRYAPPAKYFWTEHAERNAVYNAARDGIRLAGSTAYLNYSPQSICTNCVRALIQAGIVRFVGTDRELRTKGKTLTHESVNRQMIEEAGIEIITIV